MSDNTFDTTWLNTRFPFDEAARAPQVDQAYLKTQNSKSKSSPTPQLNLLDVGSGTGANFLHSFEKISAAQSWIFLDHDPRLLTASLQRIKKYAAAKNYTVLENADGLEIQGGAYPIAIQTRSGSFEAVEKLLPLEELDVVMASAFFDLFRPAQLQDFLDKVFAAKCDLLLTLNYAAMTFAPAHPLDGKMVAWYEAHMQRPQAEGAAMGPDCSRLIRQYLEAHSLPFWEGPSVWKIGGTDQAMLRFLLGFMEEAIGALALGGGARKEVADWLAQRRAEVEAERLSLTVAHFDFFALGS